MRNVASRPPLRQLVNSLVVLAHTRNGARCSRRGRSGPLKRTGNIAKVQPITEHYHLAAAQLQSAAMAKANTSLLQVVENAVGQAPGSRAISVMPEVRDGRAVASVVLLRKGEEKFQVIHQ